MIVRMRKSLMLLVIGIFLISFVFSGSVSADCDYCSESGCEDYFICEDWDSGTPPNPWPTKNGPTWHGWTPVDYGHGIDGDITTVRSNSGLYSLLVNRGSGIKDVVDLEHSISGSPTAIYIRFYIYIPSGGDIATTHLVFVNTASTAEVVLDIRSCEDHTYAVCSNEYFAIHSYGPEVWETNTVGGPSFNIEDHRDEWILVEWFLDLGNDKTSLWINGVTHISNWPIAWDPPTASKIIISGFHIAGTSTATFYIDDVVVSTSYIGPAGQGPSTCPDGVCDGGENCPVDVGSCSDNQCYEPTCNNGCGQTLVSARQTDESCSGNNFCDGSGNCVECIDNTDCISPDTCVINVCTSPGIECSDGADNDEDGQTDYPNDSGCTDANDNDETNCGDSVCEGGETCSTCADCACAGSDLCCSGVCETPACSQDPDCSDSDACTLDACSSPGACSASCSNTPITQCIDSDSCCPSGCTNITDSDCPSGESVTETWGDTPDSNHAGTVQDTFIDIDYNNYEGQEDIKTWSWSSVKPNRVANTILLKTDLSAIPQSATVTNAMLYLYQIEYYGGSQYTNTVHKLVGINPVMSEATGYSASSAEQWSPVPPGTTHNDVPLGLADIEAAEDTIFLDAINGYKTFSVTQMVQDWVSDPQTNYGLLVNGEDGTPVETGRTFASAENSNPSIRPKLVVTYSVGQEYHRADADPQDGCVEQHELLWFVGQWHQNSTAYPIHEMMEGIALWKSGAGC